MAPLLKSLLGNGSRDRELAEELRAVLQEMQQERDRCNVFLQNTRAAAEKLQEVGEPLVKAGRDIDAVAARLAELEQRVTGVAEMAGTIQTFDERAQGLAASHEQAAGRVAATLEETQQVRAIFEELRTKVDTATDLKDRLVAFLDIDQPFSELRGRAEAIRGHVDGTGEQLGKLREQYDRLVDAHKLAMAKMEALDRRRDDLSRELQDKERRVAGVDQAVRGMDGVQQTITDVRREIGSLKALGDTVVQRTAALEAQRETVERALAQADHLDRAMRQIDAGVRQQAENEKSLSALHDGVAGLRSLHETVIERSTEVANMQREADERTRVTRQELGSLSDEMKKTVERFDFENRGLESASQRVADLRGALTDCEHRFKGLTEPSLAVGELRSEARALTGHVASLTEQVGQVDAEMGRFLSIRRDLDETGRTVHDLAAQLGRVEEGRPALEKSLHELEQLNASHATVRDALEQIQVAHDEIVRVRSGQSETRAWLADVDQSVASLRDQVAAVQAMTPLVETAEKQAQRAGEAITAIEARREFVDELHKRVADLGALGARLEERDRDLQTRADAAEERFVGLASSSEEAERLAAAIAKVASQVTASEKRTTEVAKSVAAIAARCESVEELAEQTRALRPELEQRQHALAEAAKDLHQAAALRKDAAGSAQKLDELARKLTTALTTTDRRIALVDELSTDLEERSANLKTMGKRMAQFEERLTRWDAADQSVTRALEQITARQGTVEALAADLDRMFAMAEKTTAEVREITGAHQEVEQSRKLLTDVMARLQEVRKAAKTLDERQRQMAKAEERLARADALLVDVRSSLEALQGQKAIVEQAVEKAGSLQFLLKQAESAIESLREEREMTAHVIDARAGDGEEDAAEAA
ncbi:MAG: hypothetical protein HYR74_05065 [Candidatus Eisenbacteria bacterium]|nr:hypothetical protein [Candidatus Eisenbacteria bacterium]